MRNSRKESVIQVHPAGFRTKWRKLPPKRRKLPPKRRKSKQRFFQLLKRVRYVKDLCQRQSLYAECCGCTRSRLSKKSGPKNNFYERLESCMLKAGSI